MYVCWDYSTLVAIFMWLTDPMVEMGVGCLGSLYGTYCSLVRMLPGRVVVGLGCHGLGSVSGHSQTAG